MVELHAFFFIRHTLNVIIIITYNKIRVKRVLNFSISESIIITFINFECSIISNLIWFRVGSLFSMSYYKCTYKTNNISILEDHFFSWN